MNINELEEKINKLNKNMPKKIKLNKFTTITETQKFVENHLIYVKANENKQISEPYLNRLIEFIKIIEKK